MAASLPEKFDGPFRKVDHPKLAQDMADVLHLCTVVNELYREREQATTRKQRRYAVVRNCGLLKMSLDALSLMTPDIWVSLPDGQEKDELKKIITMVETRQLEVQNDGRIRNHLNHYDDPSGLYVATQLCRDAIETIQETEESRGKIPHVHSLEFLKRARRNWEALRIVLGAIKPVAQGSDPRITLEECHRGLTLVRERLTMADETPMFPSHLWLAQLEEQDRTARKLREDQEAAVAAAAAQDRIVDEDRSSSFVEESSHGDEMEMNDARSELKGDTTQISDVDTEMETAEDGTGAGTDEAEPKDLSYYLTHDDSEMSE
ncbi:MAG: hypothetical protein M1819_000533, partial [Sarea resinae]